MEPPTVPEPTLSIHESTGSVRINRADRRLKTDLQHKQTSLKNIQGSRRGSGVQPLLTWAEEDSGRPQDSDEDREVLGTVCSEHTVMMTKRLKMKEDL